MKIINAKYKFIYINDLEYFLKHHGKILSVIHGSYVDIFDLYKNRVYSGMIDELKVIYNNDIFTNNLKKSIRILFNWTRLNYLTINNQSGKLVPVTSDQLKRCPFCKKRRSGSISYHLLWLCDQLGRKDEMYWTKKQNFEENIKFAEKVQTMIDNL